MRKRYVSLVATPGLAEAHLLIFENETKWIASNPPTASSCSTPSPPLSSPRPVSELGAASLQAIEQLLQADDASRKGAKYVVRLQGLFYVGVNHISVNGRLSVTSAFKSAFGKVKHHSRPQNNHPNPSDTAGSAESYISTTWAAETTTGSAEASLSPQRPASICGLPSLNCSSTTTTGSNSAHPPTSLGLYFQDGSSTLMSFTTLDFLDAWLRLLSAVVGTNRLRSGYPHIEYASTVTCRFKAKEFNSGPFPKIKGECLFCLSKLDVLLITQNIKQPDLSIRFPYVRNCASRDDGRLCLDIGRAAPTGECELVIQLPNSREAKAAHTRCIMLMRQCPTWLKLGRDGPSSRRRTLPNFGKKGTGVNLAGPPLPRLPVSAAAPTTTDTHITDQRTASEELSMPTLLPTSPPPAMPMLPGLTSLALFSRSLSHRRFNYISSSLSHKSHSFPPRLCTESIPEGVDIDLDDPADDTEETVLRYPLLHAEKVCTTEHSPLTPTSNNNNGEPAPDPNAHYLQLNVDNLMTSHIRSIAKYTVSDAGGNVEGKGGRDERTVGFRNELTSEETIHHVLAYLSSITRPSKVVTVENEPPRSGTASRQPTVKFSLNTLMIPADQTHEGIYLEPLIIGIDQLTTKKDSQSSETNRASSTKKASASSSVQLRRPRRCLTGYASQGGVSSNESGGSVASSNRSRVYSHRDNDELFADLTYAPAASSRHTTTLCQMPKGFTCGRSTDSFKTGHGSMIEECRWIDEDGKSHKRPRTASDTGSKCKATVAAPLRLLSSSSQMADAVSRPRALSLTQQLATKPLSQPIGVKDLEGIPSTEANYSWVQLGSRSSSTTSTSKSIRRAIEHVLGRPRSTEEKNGLAAIKTSPSHHCNQGRQQDSDIYVEMDFPPPNSFQSAASTAAAAAEASLELRPTIRGSLLITPSDSLSSNSSCLSFNCGGGGDGRQTMTAIPRSTTGVNFTEHYGFVLGQAVASTILNSRTPFLMKPPNANIDANVSTTGCDVPSPATAH